VPNTKPRITGGRATLRSLCPIAGALDIVGDRWTLLIMRDLLLYEKHRFADYLAAPERIATNILSERLDRLQRCGLIERRRPADGSAREEYHPTPRGRDLGPVLRELIAGGQRHVPGTAQRPPVTISRSAKQVLGKRPSRSRSFRVTSSG
jgi:DNA-binding HxlR family transcriptional regulator